MNFFLKHLLSDKIREKTEVSWGSSENFCKNYRKTSVSKYLFNKVKTYRHSCFLVTFPKKRTTFLLRSSRRLVLKTGSLFNLFFVQHSCRLGYCHVGFFDLSNQQILFKLQTIFNTLYNRYLKVHWCRFENLSKSSSSSENNMLKV